MTTTVTLSAAASFTPEPYYQAAFRLNSQGRTAQDAAHGIVSAKTTAAEGWKGRAAAAFAARATSVAGTVEGLATSLIQHANLLEWYAKAKNTACRRAVDAAQQMEAAGFEVADDWTLSLSAAQQQATGQGFLLTQMAAMQTTLNAFAQAITLVDTQATAQLASTAPTAPMSPQEAPYTTANGYTTGEPPDRTIKFDDDFPFGSKRGTATVEDELSWLRWEAMLRGAQALRPDLDDALPMYEHYRDASGTPMTFDYEEGYREDTSIRKEVDGELNETITAANELVENGYTDTKLHSPIRQGDTTTDNWSKTIGQHHYYSDSTLRVEGDTVTLTTTVTARDRWNFNNNMADKATGIPDAENGRFEELGWARSFDTSGTLTRTVSWKVGEEPPQLGDGSGQEPGDSHDDESRDRNDWRGGWDNGGGRYPRHEPGGGDQANRYPDGRQY
ncbi:hypothetical protein [Actinomyces wuliandei]|uniref:hypothetical protein n=1 Tax=Actinomyces wuliandei TaxID=2057743 RepID=UPI000FDADE5F|nr:hypothetical protein [Actinomyces wuliandei]